MPAQDVYHQQVRNALIKDGWQITRDNYQIKFKEVKLYADLAAQSMFSAQREKQQIVVEVKSFLGISRIREFEAAIGQYLLYKVYLAALISSVTVYLAINNDIYRSFFQKEAIQFAVAELGINLIIFDVEQEVVVQWITQ
ncbi:MAG: XisH protein [Cyanothece sp. SIO2G6]|nr:XisH protein [Cyanothece sp. SIO2G6]